MVGEQETFVQKHRVKALDGDWNALKQKLSLCPPRSRAKFADPDRKEKKLSGRLINRTQSPRVLLLFLAHQHKACMHYDIKKMK